MKINLRKYYNALLFAFTPTRTYHGFKNDNYSLNLRSKFKYYPSAFIKRQVQVVHYIIYDDLSTDKP